MSQATDEPRTAPATSGTALGPIRQAFRDHPATFLAVLTGGLVVLRLVAVTGYHLDVALEMLSAGGAPNVLIGTAITLIPYLLPTAAALALALGLFAPRLAGHRRPAVAFAVLLIILAVLASPMFLLLLTVPGSVIGAFYQRRVPPRAGPQAAGDWELASGLLFAVAFLMAFNPPWLAPEVVRVGDNDVLGYIVSADARWTTILRAGDREALIVDTSSVASRTPCVLRPNLLTVALPDILDPRVGVPVCP